MLCTINAFSVFTTNEMASAITGVAATQVANTSMGSVSPLHPNVLLALDGLKMRLTNMSRTLAEQFNNVKSVDDMASALINLNGVEKINFQLLQKAFEFFAGSNFESTIVKTSGLLISANAPQTSVNCLTGTHLTTFKYFQESSASCAHHTMTEIITDQIYHVTVTVVTEQAAFVDWMKTVLERKALQNVDSIKKRINSVKSRLELVDSSIVSDGKVVSGEINSVIGKKFGFINLNGKSIFYHTLECPKGVVFKVGDKVSFTIGKNKKGPCATKLSPA